MRMLPASLLGVSTPQTSELSDNKLNTMYGYATNRAHGYPIGDGFFSSGRRKQAPHLRLRDMGDGEQGDIRQRGWGDSKLGHGG